MARNRLFGTWVLATLSLLDIRQGATSHSAETRPIKYAREALSDSGCGAWWALFCGARWIPSNTPSTQTAVVVRLAKR